MSTPEYRSAPEVGTDPVLSTSSSSNGSSAPSRIVSRVGTTLSQLRASASARASQASSTARQGINSNPLGFALSGVGLGLVAGMLAPASSKETEAVAPAAGRVRSGVTALTGQLKGVVQDALEQGKRLESESRA